LQIRNVEPSDYLPIISVIDSWWGGRHMADMLPKLFFVHFRDTSFIAEEDGTRLGFLIGFISQTRPDEAYIHFVGVHPDHRKRGIGEALYERFFETVNARGCTTVHCVTSPVNKGSIAFHTRMGFTMEAGDAAVDGLPVKLDYDGAGQGRVCFVKHL
jgi:GNAT superfamily N-acetyltransferase